MELTPEDNEFLQADKATPEADSGKTVEVVNLVHNNLVKAIKLMWCQLFLTWALIIILLSTVYFPLIHKTPPANFVAVPGQKLLEKPSSTPEISVSAHVPQAEQLVRSTDIPEWQEVRDILDQVRKAQLEKDISLLLSTYSPTFPNRNEKKENLLRSWHRYNYLNMNFNIENIQKQNAHTIIAEVAWDITLEDIHSGKRVNLMKDYIIHFSKVSGKPLIQEVTQGKRSNKGGSLELNERML